jgi:ferredoxin
MKALQSKAAELLEKGMANLLIGFIQDRSKQVVPCFIEKATEVEWLIFGPECKNNLAVFLSKPEVKAYVKVALVANFPTLKTVLQLASENQLTGYELTLLTVDKSGDIVVLSSLNEVENYVQSNIPPFPAALKEQLDHLNALSATERWQFWKDQFSLCVKCYACRGVCPMCYCTQCTVDCNQPQWIRTGSDTSANFEWHVMRAMHLGGRCIGCGECGRACPAGIPIHLLTAQLNMDIQREFGSKAGFSAKSEYALNTFKPNDKEQFIK